MQSKLFGSWVVVLLTMVWATTSRVEAQQASLPPEVIAYADTVLYNGKIMTADEDFSVVEAVAVRDGKFMARGETDRILTMAGPNTRRIDLQGKTVTPGIMDLHGGPSGRGMKAYWAQKSIPGEPEWTSKEEVLDGIKRAVARNKPGEVVVIPRTSIRIEAGALGGRSGNFCDLMTLEEVDAVSPNNPVFFQGVVNSTTFMMNSKAADLSRRFLPKSMDLGHPRLNYRPLGVDSPFVKENNICLLRSLGDVDGIMAPGAMAGNDIVFWAAPPEDHLDMYKAEVSRFSQSGVTLGKQHMGVPLFNGIRALWEQGELNIRFRMPFPMVPQISGHVVELPDDVNVEAFFRRWANMSHIGDNMLRIVGLRIAAVGGNVPGGDAWMLDAKTRAYPDRAGLPAPFGGRMEEQAAVERGDKNTFRGREVLIQAVRFGWDVSCDHCIGDRAIREVVAAFEEGLRTRIVNRPNQRLTTNHTPMAHPDEIKKMAELGIWSSISTGHVMGGTDGRDLEAGLLQFGIERVNNMVPMQSYITAGSRPSLEGTMWDWGPPRGIEGRGVAGRTAFFWIGKAINRKDEKYGRVWNPSEALTRQQALWAVSLWSADQLAEVEDLGSIEVGKEADLIIIDRDYMTVPEDDIQKIQVLLTMVEGRVVYEKEGAL